MGREDQLISDPAQGLDRLGHFRHMTMILANIVGGQIFVDLNKVGLERCLATGTADPTLAIGNNRRGWIK